MARFLLSWGRQSTHREIAMIVKPAHALRRAVLGAALALGCGARPLPLSAQAGSSIGIALAGEVSAGDSVGYGGELLRTRGRYDDQRGELVFLLREDGSGVERELQTRIVTRVWPDPASEIGMANQVDAVSAGFGISQLLAILDIPASVPPGIYDLNVRRRRRDDSGASEALPAILYGQRFTVLPPRVGGVDGAPTPSASYAGAFGSDVSAQLANLVPLPKVVLSLPSPLPHAAHLVVAYPAAKITPRAVFEEQHLGRGSIVAWTDDPAAGRVSVDFVDPAASVKALALVFEPKAPLSAGRIALSEISIPASVLYDGQGAVRGGSVTPTSIR
jgi:hypothetical protein